eukprot:COSAG05_NODE_590_length_8500_cov_9.363290_7_plen_101_part_00
MRAVGGAGADRRRDQGERLADRCAMYKESADSPALQSMHIARICVPPVNPLYTERLGRCGDEQAEPAAAADLAGDARALARRPDLAHPPPQPSMHADAYM